MKTVARSVMVLNLVMTGLMLGVQEWTSAVCCLVGAACMATVAKEDKP